MGLPVTEGRRQWRRRHLRGGGGGGGSRMTKIFSTASQANDDRSGGFPRQSKILCPGDYGDHACPCIC